MTPSSSTSDQGFISASRLVRQAAGSSRNRCEPLCFRPGVIKPGTTSAASSRLDFAETFLDAAGLSVPDDMQGHSLVPLLKGQTPRDWRSSLITVFEYPVPHHVAPLWSRDVPVQAGPFRPSRPGRLGALRPEKDPHERARGTATRLCDSRHGVEAELDRRARS